MGAARDAEKLIWWKRQLFPKLLVEAEPGVWVAYEPHLHQAQLHFDPKGKVFVVSSGQRAGKTISAAAEVVAMLNVERSRTWIAAPNYELTDRCFSQVWDWVVRQNVCGWPPGAIVKKSRTKDSRYIETVWGAFVQGKSLENPDSCVGEQLDLLIVDEAARIQTEKIWLDVLQPRLVNRKGTAILISSPRGHNWFAQYWDRGSQPEFRKDGWRRINYATSDNPYVDPKWLEKIKREVPESVWNQEYLGIPQRFSGLIWPEYRDTLYDPSSPSSGGHLFDPATMPVSSDWTHYMAGDIGYRHPTAWLWGAVDEEDNLWIYDEYCEQDLVHEDHAKAISAQTSYPIYNRWISPDAKRTNRLTRREDRLSAWEVYRSHGISCRPAHNDVNVGLTMVAKYLRATLEDHPAHPRLLISKELHTLRQAMLEYVWKEAHGATAIDPPDKPRKYQDDPCDALRYMCAGKPRFVRREIEDYGMLRQESSFSERRPRFPGQPYVRI